MPPSCCFLTSFAPPCRCKCDSIARCDLPSFFAPCTLAPAQKFGFPWVSTLTARLSFNDPHALPLSSGTLRVLRLERWDAAVARQVQEAVRLAYGAWGLHDVP